MASPTTRERLHALADYTADVIATRSGAMFECDDLEASFMVRDAGAPVEHVCVYFEEYGDTGDICHVTKPLTPGSG